VAARVFTIVLNWNGLDDTLACLASLAQLTYPAVSTVVVDNGSRVSPRAAILARHPNVTVIENPRNLGYAEGNNVGMRLALDAGADYVWVLNNDTVVPPDALAHLVDAATRHPRAAAVGAKVVRADDPSTLWMTWGRVTWLQSLIALEGQDQPARGRFDDEHRVPWIPGCSILLRAEALRAIGFFDAEYFAYHEDVEWATRAARAGWEVWYSGTTHVQHAVHGSSGGAAHYGGFRKYLSARNSVLYARRYGRAWQIALMACAIVATLPFQLVRRRWRGEQAGIYLKLRGWRDGLLDRPVPFAELGLE
jgi:hypothetical protein